MISLNDVLLAMSNIPIDDPIAEIWGRQLQGGYRIIEYTGALPITINANGDPVIDYRIYGADGGVGEPTENLAFTGWSEDFVTRVASNNAYITRVDGKICLYAYCTAGFSEYDSKYLFKTDFKESTVYTLSFEYMRPSNLTASNTIQVRYMDGSIDKLPNYINDGSWHQRVFMTASGKTVKDICCFYSSGYVYIDVNTFMIVEGSTAQTPYIPYGYKLPIVVHSELKDIGDTVSVNGALWDIVDYNNNFTRSTLLRHEVMPDMVYGTKQAIFAFPSGLAAGDYHFTIAEHSWVSTDVGKTLTFTLTQAIPEGGQLVFNGTYNTTLVGTTISSYASPTTTTATETVTMTEGDSGTDLGSLTNAGTPASNINSLQKAFLGSNEWKTSALRQYLNSNKAAGSVWTPQTIYDRPPAWATNTAGFMNGLDEDFLSCVTDTTYVTVRNTVSDGGGTDALTDKFYLPSRTEIFGSDEIANTPEGTLYAYYQGATNADRIKYRAGIARSWRLRTPYAPLATDVRNVYRTGALSNAIAYAALGFAPACQINLTKLSNSWLQNNMYKVRATTVPVYIGENQLAENEYVSYGEQKIYRDVGGTLTPTDPPVPLPEIQTIKGETIIDYDGDPKPPQMYVKYKGAQ